MFLTAVCLFLMINATAALLCFRPCRYCYFLGIVFWSKIKKRALYFISPHIGVVTYYTTSCFFNFLPSLVSSLAHIAFTVPLDTAGWHRAAARKWRLASWPCLKTFPPASQIPAMTVVCINALINE